MLQFRLRTLFIVTTAIALLAWIFFVPPGWVGVVVLYAIYILLPAVTVSGMIYHRGYRQAFFIGMAPSVVFVAFLFFSRDPFPSFWPYSFSPSSFDGYLLYKLYLGLFLLFPVASGFVAMGMRWWALLAQRRSD
jgi:hypothetical protein